MFVFIVLSIACQFVRNRLTAALPFLQAPEPALLTLVDALRVRFICRSRFDTGDCVWIGLACVLIRQRCLLPLLEAAPPV